MSITKNFIYNFMYQLLSVILPIITVPYISRVLGAEGIGKYAYTAAYAQYFILFGMLGMAIYSSRQIAYVRDSKLKRDNTFWELNILRFITIGISLIVYMILFVVLNKTDRFIYAIQALNILAAGFDISWYFIGIEDFKRIVSRNIAIRVLSVILIFLLVKSRGQVWLYILILSFSQFLGQLVMWIYSPRLVNIKRIKINNIKMHLEASCKLFITQLAIQVYTVLDRTMLGWFQGILQVGIYDNSQKIIKVALTLITSLSTVMLPYMSHAFANGKIDEFKEKIKKSILFVSFMSIPLSFGLVAIARNLVPWFFGKEFSYVEYLTYVGSWVMVPIAWSSVLSLQVLIPMKKENQYTFSVIISAIINVCLNLILIPKYKSMGTTISTVIAECVGTIIQLYLVRNFINITELFKGIYKYVIASIFMFVCIKYVDRFLDVGILYTCVEVIIGIIGYSVVMIIFKDNNMNKIIHKIRRKV